MSRKEPKEIRGPEEIPSFASEAEEAEFWATHSLGEEFLVKMEPVSEGELPPARPRTKPVAVRFDEDVLRRLKTLAESKHKGYQTMLKEFVLERLYEEEKREGILREFETSRGRGPRLAVLPDEDWSTTYRRLLVGSEGEWTDDPLSTVGSLMVVKAATHALEMSYEELAAWVRKAPEEEVRDKLLEEETVKVFRQELDGLSEVPVDELKLAPTKEAR